ncbi:MAG TPA: hypothetical protein VFC36_09030 [Paludibacter sp.]|nr:hypothetical protein [Paludibacter sp.]
MAKADFEIGIDILIRHLKVTAMKVVKLAYTIVELGYTIVKLAYTVVELVPRL